MLNAYELMKQMIEAGAAGVHFEDQLSSAKKCGHMGGKVLVSTQEAIQKLIAARLAADVLDVPTLVIARTDANGAFLLTTDIDEHDRAFVTGERTEEGFFRFKGGIEAAIERGKAYAPYADMIWCETSQPDLAEARKFAEGMHKAYPGKLLSYNCSPSFNWSANLDRATIATFQKELAAMGYKFQFVTLAGFHSLNMGMFELATRLQERGHGRLRRVPGQGVRPREGRRLHGHHPPALRRRALLRSRRREGRGRELLHRRDEGIDRRSAVLREAF